MTNNLPWVKGYFLFIGHEVLQPRDVLPQHCFVDDRNRWFDADGRELPGAVEPVGKLGLHSYQTIDDAVSEALGLQPSGSTAQASGLRAKRRH
jgi:hypothetical protein